METRGSRLGIFQRVGAWLGRLMRRNPRNTSSAALGVSPPRTYTFVPDEICVAVQTDSAHSMTVYASVQAFLNSSMIAADGVLKDLNRRQARWSVTIVRKGETHAHLYYHFEQGSGDLDGRNDNLRRTILKINRTFSNLPAGKSAAEGWQILAASPHWLGVGMQSGGDTGSPAAPPKPVPSPASSKQFRFHDPASGHGNPALQGLVDKQRLDGRHSDVVVAILDTCPTQQVVGAAATRFGGSGLWQQVTGRGSNPVSIDGPSFLNLNQRNSVWFEILPDWMRRLDAWYASLDANGKTDLNVLANLRATAYAMPDHGFFAAGIVKDIAPTAEIHLIQAIDDAGLTDMLEVTDALSVLPSGIGNGKHLIVNLSLTFSVPTFGEFLHQWGPLLAGLTRADYDLIHFSLKDVMDWLREDQGVFVVASVGNYNQPESGTRPEPRYPAYYDNVFGVAACTRQFGAATYSNRGDEIQIAVANGIAALGGDTIVNSAGQREIRNLGNGMDAIQGLFSAVDLPFLPSSATGTVVGQGSNKTGWVYWVGTSFATPIITAIAAVTWDQQPGLSPAELLGSVQKYADPAISQQGQLNCDAIWADQV